MMRARNVTLGGRPESPHKRGISILKRGISGFSRSSQVPK